MNTYSRNPTVHFSGKVDEYSHEAQRRTESHENHGWRMFSTRRGNQTINHMMRSLSYRRDRARKRQIFLRTYKLGSTTKSDEKLMKSRKLKKMVVEMKSAVVSVIAFMRGGALRSCDSRSAIHASSPTRELKY
ncbi:hypothetical protein BUALT_Bualt18G0023600 [Buddleja alternifolia]|uniref:Uncharacterized protein n=1 Tax=Buddleja alternifolia TaxID=168488 RepID=A0AAV6W335_9LAMI|nr:hypothetical protein BUALT_Bualt18G0023600 [Buddleja alternifolia]